MVRTMEEASRISIDSKIPVASVKIGGMPWKIEFSKTLNGSNYMMITSMTTNTLPWSFWMVIEAENKANVSQKYVKADFKFGSPSISHILNFPESWINVDNVTIAAYQKDVQFVSDQVKFYVGKNIDPMNKVQGLSDVEMIVEGTRFYAAKQVMSLHSQFFYDQLIASPYRCHTVYVDNVRADNFLQLLDFIYHPDGALIKPVVLNILPLTAIFQCEELCKKCEEYLIENLDDLSWTDIAYVLDVAEKYNRPALKEKVTNGVRDSSS